jgi:hypothetical protein
MSEKSSFLLIPTVGIVVALSLSLSSVNGVIVNNTDFSFEVPNGWVYKEHFVFDNGTLLTPNEFADVLINTSLLAGLNGVMVELAPDDRFPIKNAPVEIYVKHTLKGVNDLFPTYENTTVGGERAIKVFVNSTDVASKLDVTNATVSLLSTSYNVMHDDQPYFLNYMADAKYYQKYLPQFEQMVKTFKFVK